MGWHTDELRARRYREVAERGVRLGPRVHAEGQHQVREGHNRQRQRLLVHRGG